MHRLITTFLLGFVVLFTNATSGQESKPVTLIGHSEKVYAAAWLDERRVATAGGDRTIRIWDAASAKPLETLEGHQDSIFALAVSPDGSRLASGGKDGVIKLWNLESPNTPANLSGHRGSIYHLAFSPDGSRLASCGEDDIRIILWDVAEAKSLKQLNAEDPDDKNRRRSMHGVEFSPHGKQLVSCGEDRTVRLWDVEAGQEIRRFEGAEYFLFTEKNKKIERVTKKAASELGIYTVAFSPDGKQIASGGLDKTIRVWEAASGKLLQTITGHKDFIYDLSFSQNGAHLVSCGHTGHVRLWNVTTGEQYATAKSPTFIHSAAYSADLGKLILACGDSRAYVMELPRMTP